MNATGKAISIILYAIAVVITHLVAPQAMAAVAVTGVAAFFALHIAVRAHTRSHSYVSKGD